ncbi:MAG TPA: integrating conjugative element protein [Cellvibrionaceae bacterium]|nr:integrating conjugative element protein [Cellvibrionaceae bacterium]HMW71831.1 integrating conjugative element protein [Cellvibrionaceae bacterium]
MRNLSPTLLVLLLAPTLSFAVDLVRPSEDGNDWYFGMGGGDPYVNYRQTNRTTLDLEVGAEWSAFTGCSFDPRAGVIQTFKDAKKSVYGFAQDIVDSAPTLVAAWGLNKLQENYPGAYDLLTKGLMDAKASFSGAVKSCRDLQNDMSNGRDPTNGWIRFSRKATWDTASRTGENPVATEQSMDTQAANRGVTWINGQQRGGLNQAPISVVADTIDAAYTSLNKGMTGASESNGVTGEERISRVFPTSSDAAKWARSVVGESTIQTCTNCPRLKTAMGQGLRLKHREEREKVDKDLADALKATKITNDTLNKLSTPGMGIVATEEVLRGLREAPPAEQAILANRFASELALARVSEKAMITRDLLNIGSQEPNITANDTAVSQLDTARERLDRELNNILYEQEIKSKVVTQSARVLSELGSKRDRSRDGQKLEAPELRPRDVKDGGIAQ